jgi:hypothetical protein
VRPANYPSASTPGKGYCVLDCTRYSVAVINVIGNVFNHGVRRKKCISLVFSHRQFSPSIDHKYCKKFSLIVFWGLPKLFRRKQSRAKGVQN